MRLIIVSLFCLVLFGCASLSCFSIDGKAMGWCIAEKKAEDFCGKGKVKTYSPLGVQCK